MIQWFVWVLENFFLQETNKSAFSEIKKPPVWWRAAMSAVIVWNRDAYDVPTAYDVLCRMI